ncbi:MAG TPA: hypothetical protein VNJ03_15900, partial [Vicinamibacterales bacterium]|nr:hypothetical protein [Vicinamibacterales bacterium]
FLVQDDAHLYRVLRYVEANPLRAAIVQRAEQYRWSSLTRRSTPDGQRYLSEWPVARPPNWHAFVNQGIDPAELRGLRLSVQRGAPYGEDGWVQAMVKRHGLEATVRSHGPQKRVGDSHHS